MRISSSRSAGFLFFLLLDLPPNFLYQFNSQFIHLLIGHVAKHLVEWNIRFLPGCSQCLDCVLELPLRLCRYASLHEIHSNHQQNLRRMFFANERNVHKFVHGQPNEESCSDKPRRAVVREGHLYRRVRLDPGCPRKPTETSLGGHTTTSFRKRRRRCPKGWM